MVCFAAFLGWGTRLRGGAKPLRAKREARARERAFLWRRGRPSGARWFRRRSEARAAGGRGGPALPEPEGGADGRSDGFRPLPVPEILGHLQGPGLGLGYRHCPRVGYNERAYRVGGGDLVGEVLEAT